MESNRIFENLMETKRIHSAIEILLEWISTHQDQFSHMNGSSAEEQLMLLKPIGELALCCDLMCRNKLKAEFARKILEWTWCELESGAFLQKALIARPSLIMISSLYATYHRNGFYNDQLFDLIAYYSRSSFTKSMQYPYWRRLDLNLAFKDLGITSQIFLQPELTWSFHMPHPWMIDNESAYSLTHEVFYITDFGENKKQLSDEVTNYIKRWLPAWREIFLNDGNLDIFAELLMTSKCIGNDIQINNDFAIITKEILKDGYVRGPTNGGRRLAEGVSSPIRREFLKNYHSTLVGTMALSLNNK